jgi:hypothetical protein
MAGHGGGTRPGVSPRRGVSPVDRPGGTASGNAEALRLVKGTVMSEGDARRETFHCVNDSDSIDDLTAEHVKCFRMERMGKGHWWMCLYFDQRPDVTIRLGSATGRAAVTAFYEEDPKARGVQVAGPCSPRRDDVGHEEEIAEARVLGYGDGQEQAIADVNAGRVDDLIAPRLAAALGYARSIVPRVNSQLDADHRTLVANAYLAGVAAGLRAAVRAASPPEEA